MPFSLNGKLDRRALPAPGQEAFAARAFEPPVGPAEQAMAALWIRVLNLPPVGREDNFFELGGDSLGAMRLVSLFPGSG